MEQEPVRTEQPIAAKGKPGRGRPFTRNDPRINRGGVPSDIRAFHNWLREAFAKVLQEGAEGGLTKGERIIRKLIQMAIDGDMKAIEYVLDRMGGKPMHAVEVRSTSSFDFSFMSAADRIRALESVDRIRRMTEQPSKPPELPVGDCMSPEESAISINSSTISGSNLGRPSKKILLARKNRNDCPHGVARAQCFTCANIL